MLPFGTKKTWITQEIAQKWRFYYRNIIKINQEPLPLPGLKLPKSSDISCQQLGLEDYILSKDKRFSRSGGEFSGMVLSMGQNLYITLYYHICGRIDSNLPKNPWVSSWGRTRYLMTMISELNPMPSLGYPDNRGTWAINRTRKFMVDQRDTLVRFVSLPYSRPTNHVGHHPSSRGIPRRREWTPKESLKQQRRGSQEKQAKTHENPSFKTHENPGQLMFPLKLL